jgi:ATP-dependent Lhr-like helicase
MGDASQQEFGRRNFLELVSAFCSPPVFTVWQGTREIGSIDQNLLWNMQGSDQRLIRLAGKDWEIASIDWKTQSLHVTPATQQGKPLWLGQGAALSFQLCQSVRQLLTESAEPDWLSRRGRAALSNARAEYEFLHRQPSGIIGTDRGLEWHTFAGGHCNLAISQAISRQFGCTAQSDDFSICVDKTDRLTQTALEELRASTPAAALAAVVAPPPKWLDQLKFSACLPESIGESVFRARLHLEGLESVWQTG